MDLQQAQRQLTAQLIPLYGGREASNIADWVMESLTGRKRLDRLVHSTETLSPSAFEKYAQYSAALLAHIPVQYVLHESFFAGLRFYVDERVLIPRPETEELVEWVASSIASSLQPRSPVTRPPLPPTALLDVGTGSGCIAISLAKKFPALDIHACDISTDALDVARQNASTLDAGKNFHFHQLDFLDSNQWANLPPIRWLVSNPPYIPISEKSAMAAHVTGAEPSLALFVADNDPLIFYRSLGSFARQRLGEGGALFVEIHEEMSAGVVELFRTIGAKEVEVRKDLQGKARMIKAIW
jgi:release factor glutamine methyltransferase